MLVSHAVKSMWQNVWAHKTMLMTPDQKINLKLLFMTGLDCSMWVSITPNIHVMEI
jgi:hypothetical protein